MHGAWSCLGYSAERLTKSNEAMQRAIVYMFVYRSEYDPDRIYITFCHNSIN